jgi:hypothetical protein
MFGEEIIKVAVVLGVAGMVAQRFALKLMKEFSR